MKNALKKIPGIYTIRKILKKLRPNGFVMVEKLGKIEASLLAIEKSQKIVQQAAANPYLSEMRKFVASKQMNFLETLDYVRDNKVSMTRFGDGEIRMMLRFEYKLRFQRNSLALRQALRETIEYAQANPKKILLGFPHPYEDTHWTGVWVDIWEEAKELFGKSKVLGDAHVSRPVFFMEHGQEGVEAWRSIWADKKIAVITGKGSRFELLPALFGSAMSTEFIWSSPTNGFEDIERLVAEAKKSGAELFVISLGPAGTVLAANLAAAGKWALDIGHISDSYQNVFEGQAWPESKSLTAKKR